MAFQIRVQPGQHVFQAEADESLLDAALRQGFILPYGCRDGTCGACRGKVLSGQVDYGKALPLALSEADRLAGMALFCCARALGDLTIESLEGRSAQEIPVKTLPARVQKLTLAVPDVMLVELKLPASQDFRFLAGQYVDILLRDGQRRAFSLANAPHDAACLQLHIRHVPGGLFTDQVFGAMKVRDMLRLNGPHGSFFLRENSDKPMLLVAGGTGFAPIKSMVEYAIAENLKRPMAIYWGARTRADLYLQPVAEQWAAAYSHIRFVPVLSEALAEDGWCGRTGLVHVAAMQDFPDLSGFQVYVCGSPAMVAASRRDFVGQCHLPEDELFTDAFTFAGERAGAVQNPSNIPG